MAQPQVSPVMYPVTGGRKYLNGTASQAVKSEAGELLGVFVASSSSGTIKFWDSLAGSGAVLINTFTPDLGWNPCPFSFTTGLFITVAGTIDYTVSYS